MRYDHLEQCSPSNVYYGNLYAADCDHGASACYRPATVLLYVCIGKIYPQEQHLREVLSRMDLWNCKLPELS